MPRLSRVLRAEGVHIAGRKKFGHPGPLFGEVARIFFIILRPGQVYGGMGDVIIAA
jgi:hypothetical protein